MPSLSCSPWLACVCAGLVDGPADALQHQASRVAHRLCIGQVHLEALHKPAGQKQYRAVQSSIGQAGRGGKERGGGVDTELNGLDGRVRVRAYWRAGQRSCHWPHALAGRQTAAGLLGRATCLPSRVRSLRCSKMRRAMGCSCNSSSTCRQQMGGGRKTQTCLKCCMPADCRLNTTPAS